MADTVTRATPTPKQYWLIAFGLAVITAVEIAVAYIEAFDPILVPLLLALSAVKFVVVVGWFMHLRFDLLMYRRFFLFGLIGAPLLFLVTLLTFTGYAP